MPPKGSRKSAIAAPSNTLVLDNGAYTIKASLLTSAARDPSYDDCAVIPNCIARSIRDKCSYTASELDSCKDFGELAFRRPVEKGFTGAAAAEGLRVGTRCCKPRTRWN
jgi:actin-related protein 6